MASPEWPVAPRTEISFGHRGAEVDPSDTVDLDPIAKAVTVISTAGGDTLSILPAGNADGATIDYVGVQVGFTPPFHVRRVYLTGTLATVATVDA